MDRRQEFDVSVVDKRGQTPLHLAVKIGNVDGVQKILRSKAKVNAKDEHGWQPLHYAGRLRSTDTAKLRDATGVDRAKIVNLLYKAGADGNARTFDDERTSLHIAARSGALPVIRALLAHGANPLVKDVSGRSPLDMIGDDIAVESGLLKIITEELNQGRHAEEHRNGTMDELDDRDRTALHLLCVDYLEVKAYLLSRNFDPTQIFDGDSTAQIRLACLYPNPTAVGLRLKLLRMGFRSMPEDCIGDCEEPHEDDLSEVHHAGQLLDAGADVNARTMRQRLTPLHVACAWGKAKMVKLLVARGADVNAISGFGYTPLDVVELSSIGANDRLLDKLEDVKKRLKDKGGVFASSLPRVAVLELQMALRRRFGDTTIKWEVHVPDDLHPLHGACVVYENLAAVFLLNGLAPASAFDGDRAALVHHACIHAGNLWHGLNLCRAEYLGDAYGLDSKAYLNHSLEVFSLLMSTDANVCTHTGVTPLHLAGMYGTEKIISLLLAHGAEPNVRSKYGTPLDLIDKMLERTNEKGERPKRCSCDEGRAGESCRHLEYPIELARRRNLLESRGAKNVLTLWNEWFAFAKLVELQSVMERHILKRRWTPWPIETCVTAAWGTGLLALQELDIVVEKAMIHDRQDDSQTRPAITMFMMDEKHKCAQLIEQLRANQNLIFIAQRMIDLWAAPGSATGNHYYDRTRYTVNGVEEWDSEFSIARRDDGDDDDLPEKLPREYLWYIQIVAESWDDPLDIPAILLAFLNADTKGESHLEKS